MKKIILFIVAVVCNTTLFADNNSANMVESNHLDSFPLLEQTTSTNIQMSKLDSIDANQAENQGMIKKMSRRPRKEVDKSWNEYYSSYDFSPFDKGSWYASLILSVSTRNQTNKDLFILELKDRDKESFEVGVSFAYFVRKYMGVGANISYSQSSNDIDFKMGEDSSNIQYFTEKYLFAPFLRNYIPLSKNERFSVYNETRLSIGYGQKALRIESDEDTFDKAYGESFIAELGLAPGLTMFVVENFAFEIGVNVVGLKVDYTTYQKNDGPLSEDLGVDFDFEIELLSLNFGLVYYF